MVRGEAALAVSGWAAWTFTVLLALGGASSRPSGIVLGLPPIWQVLIVLVFGAWTIRLAGWAAGRPLAGLWVPVLALLLAAPHLTSLRAWSGSILLPLAIAGLVLVLPASVATTGRRLFFPLVAVLYLAAAARVQARVGPQGDEPHYLMVADSLLRDGDLAVERDFAEGRYRAFHPETLAPHYRVRGREGVIYSLHAVGLSLVILPAYALGGYAGASFFMALLAALLAREARRLVSLVNDDPVVADVVGWGVALSPPLLHYAGLVFTEVPAALLVALAIRRHAAWPGGVGHAVGLGVTIGFLPWLNVRYAWMSAVLLTLGLVARSGWRTRLALVAPVALSALGIAVQHFVLYGFFDPRRVYGARPEFSRHVLPEGLPGLFLDQEFGLLIYAPLFALAAAGVVGLTRRSPALAGGTVAAVAGIVLVAASWPMWRGGFNPPARFLLPLLPWLVLLIVGGAGARSPAVALLVGWSVWAGLAGAVHPEWVHRDRQGTAPLFEALSGAADWTRLLPGFVLSESAPDRAALSFLWGLVLLAAVAGRRRPATALGLGTACLVLLGAAALGSRLSTAPETGRSAVGTLGRPVLALPAWRFERAAVAEWDARRLSWGGLYEPHRHPAGVALGQDLRLASGAYRLEIDTLPGWPAGTPPVLEIWERNLRLGRVALEPGPGGLRGRWVLPPGHEEVTLIMREGGHQALATVRLEAQPSDEPPV